MYFDTHLHLDMLFKKGINPDDAIKRAVDAGVAGMISIAGSDIIGDFKTTRDIIAPHKNIYMAAGFHPHVASDVSLALFDKLRAVLDEPSTVALGETGLDYHYNFSPAKEQRRIFAAQIKMAREMNLPVIVHTRDADEDTVAILKDEGVVETGGVIHCFSAGERLAEEALNLGMYISFSGILTFPKAEDVQAVAQTVREDRLLVETDSPYLSPVPFRGRTNEPARVKDVASKLAELRGVSIEKLGESLIANSKRCFNITGAAV